MLNKTARYGLWTVVAVSGLVIALRMLFGPFDNPIRVRTPLNPEGWFGLAVTILLFVRRTAYPDEPAFQQRRSGWWTAVAIVGLIGITAVCFWRTIRFFFLADDFGLLLRASKFQFAIGPVFATPGSDGFFRPIANITMALTSMWAGLNPSAWHATAVALHGANVALVFMVASRLCVSLVGAFFAAALFAIHGARPEAVAWIGARFDLLATFFVLAGLLTFLRSCRESSNIGYIYELIALVCMVLAILSKEAAFVFPLLLVLMLIAERELHRNRIAVLIPFFVTAVALFAYRWWLFRGIGGYRDPHTGAPQALILGLSTVKTLAISLWTALYFPINWTTEPGAWLTALMLAYMGALVLLAASRPNRAKMMAGVGFIVVSAIPPLHLLGIGADLGNSRLLYLPSVGFCMTLAFAAEGLRGPRRWTVPALIVAFHVAALQHNLNVWDYVFAKGRAAALVAVQCNGLDTKKITDFSVPRTLRGIPFFANADSDEVRFVLTAPLKERSPSATLVWDRSNEELRCAQSQTQTQTQ